MQARATTIFSKWKFNSLLQCHFAMPPCDSFGTFHNGQWPPMPFIMGHHYHNTIFSHSHDWWLPMSNVFRCESHTAHATHTHTCSTNNTTTPRMSAACTNTNTHWLHCVCVCVQFGCESFDISFVDWRFESLRYECKHSQILYIWPFPQWHWRHICRTGGRSYFGFNAVVYSVAQRVPCE